VAERQLFKVQTVLLRWRGLRGGSKSVAGRKPSLKDLMGVVGGEHEYGWPLEHFISDHALLTFMNRILVGRLHRRGLWLAACLVLVASDRVSAGTTAGRPESQIYQLPIPIYGDKTPWGIYFRQLQDTVATRWYQEITYYTHRYEYNWGSVTARYTVTPDGSFHNPQVLSNTCGPAMPSAVIRSIRKTWIQPFPPEVASMAPGGLVVEQTFRFLSILADVAAMRAWNRGRRRASRSFHRER